MTKGVSNRRSGGYAVSDGYTLPAGEWSGKPGVPCPRGVGRAARSYWRTWARSPYAAVFDKTNWQDLANTTLLLDKFYTDGDVRSLAEARQHERDLFGVSMRSRLHIRIEGMPGVPAAEGKPQPVSPSPRTDPRLKAV